MSNPSAAPPSITEDTVHVLHGLLDSIPSFWSPADLAPVIRVYVEDPRVAPSLTSLMKALAKKAPPKVLLPTMTRLWPEVSPQTVRCLISVYLSTLLNAIPRAMWSATFSTFSY
jgi:U3 small nucleolar RNA-associated protein 10